MVAPIRASPADADVAAKCCTALANLFVGGGAGADADGGANADNGGGTFNLAGGTTTLVSTQRPSAFVARSPRRWCSVACRSPSACCRRGMASPARQS